MNFKRWVEAQELSFPTLAELGCQDATDMDERVFARSVKTNLKPQFWDDNEALLALASTIFPHFNHSDNGFKINGMSPGGMAYHPAQSPGFYQGRPV
jgi:hypothetical protein